MQVIRPLVAACGLLLWGQAALAASSATSAASGSVGASVGSASGSLQGSSASSGQAVAVIPGDYRVLEVAAVPGRPGVLRLALQAVDVPGPAGQLALHLPEQAYASSRLAAGGMVHAQHRPYGVEFARADTREAFFLVLADDWHRQLQSVPVQL